MADDDTEAMAAEIQGMLGEEGFDPFGLFEGERRFHSVFFAPPSPGIAEALERYRRDGGGPLAELVAAPRPDGGTPSPEERLHLRGVLLAATGLVVTVVNDEQRYDPFPHLHVPGTDPLPGLAERAGRVVNPDDLEATAATFRRHLAEGVAFPRAWADAAGTTDHMEYWESLADGLLESLAGGILPGTRVRQGILLHYAAEALGALLDPDEDGDALLARSRCHLLADQVDAGLETAHRLLRTFEPVDEECLKLLEDAVDACIRNRCPERALDLFRRRRETIDAVLGGLYEAARCEFRAAAAAQVSPKRLLAAADALRCADKRSFRHDLNREAIWRVTVRDPGPCLEVEEAADLLGRSVNFVAKRVSAGTIPCVARDEDGEDLAIPRAGLEAWRLVVETYDLID